MPAHGKPYAALNARSCGAALIGVTPRMVWADARIVHPKRPDPPADLDPRLPQDGCSRRCPRPGSPRASGSRSCAAPAAAEKLDEFGRTGAAFVLWHDSRTTAIRPTAMSPARYAMTALRRYRPSVERKETLLVQMGANTLSGSGRRVRLVLLARRFHCDAVLCGRRICTERFRADVLAPSSAQALEVDRWRRDSSMRPSWDLHTSRCQFKFV